MLNMISDCSADACIVNCYYLHNGAEIGNGILSQGDEGLISINIRCFGGYIDKSRSSCSQYQRLAEIHSIYSSLGGHGTNTGVNFGTCFTAKGLPRSRTAKEIAGTIRLCFDILMPNNGEEVCNIGGKAGESDISVEVSGIRYLRSFLWQILSNR